MNNIVRVVVHAAQGQQPPAFAVLDKDRNGSITAAARLTQLDVNADSKLSREE